MSQDIFQKTLIPLLSKGLDVSMLRQRSTSANIANATTPGYKRSEVRFEEQLQQAVERWNLKGERTNARHMALGDRDLAQIQPEVLQPDDPALPSGINNVDIDHEMAELAKNQLKYQLNIRLLTRSFSALRTSIYGRPSGGR
jgi:flagellar basal-body rod protein FlgB